MAAEQTFSQQPEFENKVIQHIGLISGICDESGLVEFIDERVHQPRRFVSVGQAVKAMILNALGFSGRALYLTPRFYKNRPVDVLIGEGLSAIQLNDASLGTALDALYETGITELFFSVSQQILTRYGIPTRFAYLDSTTFSLHGDYNSDWDPEMIPEGVILVRIAGQRLDIIVDHLQAEWFEGFNASCHKEVHEPSRLFCVMLRRNI